MQYGTGHAGTLRDASDVVGWGMVWVGPNGHNSTEGPDVTIERLDACEKLRGIIDPLAEVLRTGTPAESVPAKAVANLSRIVLDQSDRLAALEPCVGRNDGGPHLWLDDGACGYCRVTRART